MFPVAVTVQKNVMAFPRLHMGAICKNMNTHIDVGKEKVVGIHVDLNVDVNFGVWSSLFTPMLYLV